MTISYFLILFFHFFVGLFLLLQGGLARLIIGMIILGNGLNLALFRFSNLSSGHFPIIQGKVLTAPYSDPLPQALILTAIVIGMGLVTYFSFLAFKSFDAFSGDAIGEDE